MDSDLIRAPLPQRIELARLNPLREIQVRQEAASSGEADAGSESFRWRAA